MQDGQKSFRTTIYKYQIEMLKKNILSKRCEPLDINGFQIAKRPLPYIQDFFHRKGLISNRGEKKEAFYILQNFYKTYRKL